MKPEIEQKLKEMLKENRSFCLKLVEWINEGYYRYINVNVILNMEIF